MEPKYLVEFSDAPNYGETSNVTPHELAYHLLPKIDTKFGDALKLMEFDVFETVYQAKDGDFCPRVKMNLFLLVDELGDEEIQNAFRLYRKTGFLLEGSEREFAGDCFDFINKNPVKEYHKLCAFLVEQGYIPEFMPANEFGEYSQIRQDELKLCVEAGMSFDISFVGGMYEPSETYRYNITSIGFDMSGTDLSELVHLVSMQAGAILDARRAAVVPSGA